MKNKLIRRSYHTYNGNKAFADLQENGSLKVSVEGFGDGKYKNDGFVISKNSMMEICAHLKNSPQNNPAPFPQVNKKAYTFDEKRAEQGMNAYNPWTKDEEDVLRRLFDTGMKVEDIARRMKRGTGSIQSRLSKLGLI